MPAHLTSNLPEQIGNAEPVDTIPLSASDLVRGLRRLLLAKGFSPIAEFTLANHRRLDVAAIDANGTIIGIEIKISLADLRGDEKWPDYLGHCDQFYFAIPPQFPRELVPTNAGLIVADRYDGEILRSAPPMKLHPSRRRAVTLRFAQIAATRLAITLDPNCM